MDGATSLQNIIDYHFKNDKLLNEAVLAAGASVSDVQVDGNKQGNKGLALIGDALIRLAIVDQGYADGARTGESSDIVKDRGSNMSLVRDAHKLDLGKFVIKNPSQGKSVSRSTLASTVEALVGAVWLDSVRDFERVRAVIKRLRIIDDGGGSAGEQKD
ncbi:ribonuclease III domain-containing protein [Diaporthe sp. PMI_573]|nr:ribonuclease III domain-containing protein [Diaporthaceae sp. PMI_573]